MGLLAIADQCEREGISVKIINYPLEQILDAQFSLEEFLKSIHFKVCGIALHWVLHSHGAIEIARTVKRVNPNAKVVLGGFSATYFHKQILKYFKEVDAVIRGEGEVPFVEYYQRVAREQTLESVQNLSYRTNANHIKHNPQTYIAKSLDDFCFTNLSLIHNFDKYITKGVKVMRMQFPIPIARGCPFNCPYCGGGGRAQVLINKRRKVLLRSPEKVVEDIRTLSEVYNIKGVFFGHGTYSGTLKYWKTLFKQIQTENLDMGADLEIWRLPFPKEMWSEYRRTFIPEKSSISVCPRSLSPNVQRKIREVCDPTYSFPESQIQNLIEQAIQHQIVLRIWFTIGFPFQTRKDLLKDYLFTLKLAMKYGTSKHYPITVLNDMVTIIPGSPAFENPKSHDVSLTFKDFRQVVDMYRRSRFMLGGWNTVINYQNKYLSNIEMRFWNRLFNVTELSMLLTSHH
jgi:radical SAM superfamily enzyme YgiQ (UPF0313 family)